MAIIGVLALITLACLTNIVFGLITTGVALIFGGFVLISIFSY